MQELQEHQEPSIPMDVFWLETPLNGCARLKTPLTDASGLKPPLNGWAGHRQSGRNRAKTCDRPGEGLVTDAFRKLLCHWHRQGFGARIVSISSKTFFKDDFVTGPHEGWSQTIRSEQSKDL